MLMTIIVILFLALLIVFSMRYQENREEVLAETGGGPSEAAADLSSSGTCSALRYDNGSATLSFALNEKGEWTWSDGPDFPLNGGTVESIVETLSNLKFQQVLPATESKEEYGLDEPSATLTVSGEEGEQSLIFGKTTTDGDSYYMMMNGDESTVYIVADTLVKLMEMPIYDMCVLPELPKLSEKNLRAVTIQGPAPAEEPSDEEGEEPEERKEPERPTVTLTAKPSDGKDGSPLWFSGEDNVTASPLVQDLLKDLAAMSLSKCVDYYPSDEAAEICGFKNPDAILMLEYAENGAEGQLFSLFVGARMPDESGRYVRLEENGAIYGLATDSADALMTISVSGPRGTAQDTAQSDSGTEE